MSKVCELFGNQLEIENGEVIKVGTPPWRRWLESHSSFHYNPKAKSQQGFTARKEKSSGRVKEVDYWYGYRKVEGKLHKRYIGKSEDLTLKRLSEVARLLDQPAPSRPKSVFNHNQTALSQIEDLPHSLDELMMQVQELTNFKALQEQELQSGEIEKQNLLSSALVLRSELIALATSKEQLVKELQVLESEVYRLQKKLHTKPNLEKARDEVLKHWRVQRGAETKGRIQQALDKLITKVQELADTED